MKAPISHIIGDKLMERYSNLLSKIVKRTIKHYTLTINTYIMGIIFSLVPIFTRLQNLAWCFTQQGAVFLADCEGKQIPSKCAKKVTRHICYTHTVIKACLLLSLDQSLLDRSLYFVCDFNVIRIQL